jgi:anthranilate phosphoribosyltransferase
VFDRETPVRFKRGESEDRFGDFKHVRRAVHIGKVQGASSKQREATRSGSCSPIPLQPNHPESDRLPERMRFSGLIKQMTATKDVAAEIHSNDVQDLFAAMLDGGVPDLDLGAILVALDVMPDTLASVVGSYRAMASRVQHLHLSDTTYRPLVFASYNRDRLAPNLLPWLALTLRRMGIPVLVHGSLGGSAVAASAYVFRELDILPSSTLTGVQANLEKDSLAFAPVGVLCPGLSNLFALVNRLGLQDVAPKLEGLLDPFAGDGVRVVGVADASLRETIEDACCHDGLDALVFCGADDDAFVDPQLRPRIVAIQGGLRTGLFDSEIGATARRMILPDACDVLATARWIRGALARDVPVPYPLVNQLACCLFVSGYADDMSEAKAIAATKTGVSTAYSAMMSDSAGRTVARNAHR